MKKSNKNKIDDKPLFYLRIGFTKLFNPLAVEPLERGTIYNVALDTNRKEYREFCDMESLLNGKTIGDLLEKEPLHGPYRMSTAKSSIPIIVDLNHYLFGLEFSDTPNPDQGIYVRKDEDEYINLLTDKTNYIHLYRYDKADSKYASLNSLPAELLPWRQPNGCLHGKLELDYALDKPYVIELDFSTANDVLAAIKQAYIKMHNTKSLLPKVFCHSILYLKVEILRFNPKTGDFKVFIGS